MNGEIHAGMSCVSDLGIAVEDELGAESQRLTRTKVDESFTEYAFNFAFYKLQFHHKHITLGFNLSYQTDVAKIFYPSRLTNHRF